MRRRLRKYLILARADLLNAGAYLRPYLVGKVFLVLVLFVMFSLYRMLYQGRPAVEGFSIAMVLYYLTVTEAVEFAKVRIHETIAAEVRDGSCAYTLLRPMSYLSYHLCSNLARMALNCALTLAVGVAATSVIARFEPRIVLGMVLALPAIALAVALSFTISFIIGLLAFEMEEVRPVYWIWQKLVFIVGGMLIPLEFFPAWFRSVAQYLPTAAIAWFPAKCAVQWDPAFFLKGFAIQAGWLVFFLLLAQAMLRRGLARLQVNGG